MNSKKGPLWKSFYYAFQGIFKSLRLERNMFIHFSIMCIVIIAGFVFSISVYEWLICILLFGLVISLELVNTAIENAVDLTTIDINPKAAAAKDTAAGAVLIASIISIVIGLIIFIPKAIALLS